MRLAINPRKSSLRGYTESYMCCGAAEVRCFVTRERGQYRVRGFSIPLPLPPKHDLRWRWLCISFRHIPRCVLKNSCRQVRSICRENPILFKVVHFLRTITIRLPKRISPLPNFPLPFLTFIPGTTRTFDSALVGAQHDHHHQWWLNTPLLRVFAGFSF